MLNPRLLYLIAITAYDGMVAHPGFPLDWR